MKQQATTTSKQTRNYGTDDDEYTSVTITRGLKREYDRLFTKDHTYQQIFTEALVALKASRKGHSR